MLRLCILAFLAISALAQPYHVYVGDVGTNSAILAWGHTGGRNTIGRSSPPHGDAVVRFGDEEHRISARNWLRISGLVPDREYSYEIRLDGNLIGSGSVRTWPVRAESLAFLVMGDYGNGSRAQRELAAVMAREVERRRNSDNPVRFVLTTGDNIYGRWFLRYWQTGSSDKRWGPTFFEPYQSVLRHIPFFPTLGNHDTGDSESSADLPVYLDNFFFPGGEAAQWYSFSFGGLVDFFGLDTSSKVGPGSSYASDGEQHNWLRELLSSASSPWKIAYFHYPPFSAGPKHAPSLDALRHFQELFVEHGIQVAFNGHEHNLQFVERNERSGGIQYVVTGAGGELRDGTVSGDEMRRANVAGWAPQVHFMLVELDKNEMTITPIGLEPIRVITPEGATLEAPVRVPRGGDSSR